MAAVRVGTQLLYDLLCNTLSGAQEAHRAVSGVGAILYVLHLRIFCVSSCYEPVEEPGTGGACL